MRVGLMMTRPRVVGEAIRWVQGKAKSAQDTIRAVMIGIQKVD